VTVRLVTCRRWLRASRFPIIPRSRRERALIFARPRKANTRDVVEVVRPSIDENVRGVSTAESIFLIAAASKVALRGNDLVWLLF
jgi:hypothetical protein